jgi:hypothetical protein
MIDDRGNVAAVPRKDIKTFIQVGNLPGTTLKLFRSLLDDVSSVPACAAAREAAPVITTAKASACMKANEDRFLRRTFILLFLFQVVGLSAQKFVGQKSRPGKYSDGTTEGHSDHC